MRDKVLFFILGVVLATFVYLAADMANITAKERMGEFELLLADQIIIKDRLFVHNSMDENSPAILLSIEDSVARLHLNSADVNSFEASIALVADQEEKDASILISADQQKATGIVLGTNGRIGDSESKITIRDSDGKRILRTTDRSDSNSRTSPSPTNTKSKSYHVEVMDFGYDAARRREGLSPYFDIVVKFPDGRKEVVVFDNAETIKSGILSVYDKIEIAEFGGKYKFIRHVK